MIKQWLSRATAASLAALLALPLQQARVWAAAVDADDSQESAADGSVTLDGLDVSPDSVVIHLSGDAKYSSFVTANPPRLVIQLEGTEYQAGTKSLAGQGRFLKAVRSGQYKRDPMQTRVVLDLSAMTVYKINKNGSDILVALGAGGDAPDAGSAQAQPKRPTVKPRQAAAQVDEDEAETAAPEPGNSMAKVGEKDGMTTQSSAELSQIADKTDASRPDLEPAKPQARPVVELSTPRSTRGDIMSRMPRDLVTLDFDNTDIQDVLRLMAAKAKVNVIYGPDVQGAVTLHLTDVPFTDAFRTVLTMMNLATTQVGDNILRIVTPDELKSSQTAAATITKVIPLNYAKAGDLVTPINQTRTAEGRTGMTLADAKTNSLVVTESIEGMASTERLVAQLDVRPKQVLIEAKLVEVGLTNSLDYGIQWDYTSVNSGNALGQNGQTYNGTTVGPAGGATGLAQPLSQTANTIPPLAAGGSGVGVSGRGTGVGLPADKVFGALTLGRITNNYFVNATLTAAAANGKVKILSDPKVATLNNQAANINVTTQIPYVTSNVASTGVQTQTVSYVTTGIQLAVTPSINADGRIMLNINPNVSQPSATAAASTQTGAPAVDSRNASTTVLVRDGETVVVGGLISDSVTDEISKIPLLGDIPILGWLFKKKSQSRTRSELLIFVTPRIMAD